MPINATNEELGINVGPPLELEEFKSTLGELLGAQFQPSESVTGRALQAAKLQQLEQPGQASSIDTVSQPNGQPIPPGLVYSHRLNSLVTLEQAQQADANDINYGDYSPPRTIVSKQDALDRAKQQGVKVEVGDQGITEPALNFLIERRREEILRQSVIDRYRGGIGGSALGVGASLLGQAVDPLNIAAVFLPEVFGPLRVGAALRAATSIGERAAIRAGVGAVEGTVGVAALEPFSYAASQKLQDDYTLATSLQNIAFGTFLGAGLHSAGGAIFDAIKGRAKLGIPERPPSVIPETGPSGLVVARPRTVDEVVSELQSKEATLTPEAQFAKSAAEPVLPTTREGETIPRYTGGRELPDVLAGERALPDQTGRAAVPTEATTLNAEPSITLTQIGGRARVPEAANDAVNLGLVASVAKRSPADLLDDAAAVLAKDPSQRTLADLLTLRELKSEELKRAAEIQARPGFTHTLEEKLFLKDIRNGGEADYANQRIAQALKRIGEIDQALLTKSSPTAIAKLTTERNALQDTVDTNARRLAELGVNPYAAPTVLERLSNDTKATALRAGIAQDLQGKPIDVAEIIKQDAASGYTSSPTDVQTFFDRQINSSQIGSPLDDAASLYGALRLKDSDVVATPELAASFAQSGEDAALATLRARGVNEDEIQALTAEADAITQKGELLAQAAEKAVQICEVI